VRDVISAGRRDAIPRNTFTAGQTVSCTVTPSDGKIDGTPVTVTATATNDGWSAVGPGKYGQPGVPFLEGSGPLTPGSPGSLSLSLARPNSLAILFLGFTAGQIPFQGGTLVPFPIALPVSFNTGPTGGFTLPFVWPTGVPSGTQVAIQMWIQDASAYLGSAATNGVVLTAP
jgi:hypothetical protein